VKKWPPPGSAVAIATDENTLVEVCEPDVPGYVVCFDWHCQYPGRDIIIASVLRPLTPLAYRLIKMAKRNK